MLWQHCFGWGTRARGKRRCPEGVTPRERVAEACAAYEEAIRAAGGIDFQLLGIGKTGHVGFNEPGSDATSRTRIVTLDTLTRKRSEEHTSELQSPCNLVCRLLLEKKKKNKKIHLLRVSIMMINDQGTE